MIVKLSMSQQDMLEKIGQYRWRRLSPLKIALANQTLKSLISKGLVQIRNVDKMGAGLYEVRRVAMQDAHGKLRDAVLRLIDAMPSETRRVLVSEISAVLVCIVQEEA